MREGEGGGGQTDLVLIWPPLPFIPSHRREGSFYQGFPKKLETNSQTFCVRLYCYILQSAIANPQSLKDVPPVGPGHNEYDPEKDQQKDPLFTVLNKGLKTPGDTLI